MVSHELHDVSNHCWLSCLFNSLFKLTTPKKSKFCVTGHLWGEFLSQNFSCTANVKPCHDLWCIKIYIFNFSYPKKLVKLLAIQKMIGQTLTCLLFGMEKMNVIKRVRFGIKINEYDNSLLCNKCHGLCPGALQPLCFLKLALFSNGRHSVQWYLFWE